MRYRFQPWQLTVLVIVLCSGAVYYAHRRMVSRIFSPSDLIQYLPQDQSVHVYIDVDLLRKSGLLDLLAGSKASEEPDYRKFVEQSGFDYRNDLDGVAAAFMHGDTYLVLRGRFNWTRLNDYAKAQGGTCRGGICWMAASTSDRYLSFYAIRSDILAYAVSREERGTNMIGPSKWLKPPQLPAEPVWISAPSYMFRDVSNLPEGTHSFFSPLAQGQEVMFAVGPQGQRLQIRMEASCDTPEVAKTIANQLMSTTDLLKKMIEREHMTPNAQDLSGVLVAGSFQQQDRKVTGAWPIERGFIEALAGGKVQ